MSKLQTELKYKKLYLRLRIAACLFGMMSRKSLYSFQN
jgi:hypothetical protein